MFKKTFTKIVAIMAVTFGVSFVTPAMNQYANQTTVAHADASTLAPDGPWETSNENKPAVQQLHNGNEIYYSIAPDDTNTDLFQSAVSKWNALGVVKLVQVNWGDSQSQITMQSVNSDGPTTDDEIEDGNTSFTGVNNLQNTAIIGQANIKLYNTVNDLPSKNQSVLAQHELGHALGFAHDNRTLKSNGKKYRHYHFVMNEYDTYSKYYKLGGIEQHMLESHYNLTASVDLSDMNC